MSRSRIAVLPHCGQAKPLSLPSLLVNIGYLLAVAGTILIFVLMRRRRILIRLLLGFTIVIFVSSIIVIVGGFKDTRLSKATIEIVGVCGVIRNL